MKALRLFMVLAALALVVPGWALAQGASVAQASSQVLVLPQGQELSEEELQQVEGGNPWVLGGVSNVIEGYIEARVAGREYTWEDATWDFLTGAVTGGVVGRAVGKAAQWVERTFFVPRGTGKVIEDIGGAVGGGAVHGVEDRIRGKK